MIRAIILDDEKHSVATLDWKLDKFCPDVKVIGKFTDSMKALEYIRQNPPDLLFLDVEMPRLNGFELLEELDKPLSFEVILITAYDEFGIRAVKSDILDYLLKPVQNQELKKAIDKVKRRMDAREISSSSVNYKSDKIAFATKESIEYVAAEDIIACKSDSNYTILYLVGGRKKVISRTLKDVEDRLKSHTFYRSHNSHLVNLSHIKEYIRSDGGYLLVTDGHKLPISRTRKDELLKLLA